MPSHAERRVLPYLPEQLFDLVVDVEHYPAFLPWCLAARVKSRTETEIIADLVIGFKMIRERFTSRVVHDRATLTVVTTNVEGPFRHLRSDWAFHPNERGCEVVFTVDFEFRSRLLQRLIQSLFHEAVRRMVAAFEGRARTLYTPVGAEEEASAGRKRAL